MRLKVLVTGGAGFIGTNLIKRLLKDGQDVISIDNYSTGKLENHQDGCKYLDFDCVDTEGWKQIKEFWGTNTPDVIFHLAALARIQPSFENPSETIDANVMGTVNVLEYARKDKIPVVYSGSSSVHSGKFMNPYTFSKHQGEDLCVLYSELYEVPTTICRFYNVYGPHHLTEGDYCTVIGIFETQYENREALTVTGDGEQRRDFTHVEDIVDGLMRCSEHFTFKGEIFELGSGENFSINVIADSFDGGKEYIEARPGEACDTLCTDKKAHKLLGWKPKHNILDYIEEFRNEIDFIHNTLPK